MQKSKLSLSLILASFLLIFSYSLSSAQSVSFEDKTVPYCADVFMNVTVSTPTDLGAFEVIFEVGGDFASFDVDFSTSLPQMFTVQEINGNVVRLAGIKADQNDVCLPQGDNVVAVIHFVAGDVCGGQITVAGATVDDPFTHGSNFVECAAPFNEVIPDVGTGTVNLVNGDPVIACPTVDPVHFGETVEFDVTATDDDLSNGCEVLTFTKVSGPGTLTTAGHFSWATGGDDICENEVVIQVTDKCGATDQCTVNICVFNEPPVAEEGDELYTVMGISLTDQVVATDPDGGPSQLHYSFASLEKAGGGGPADAATNVTVDPTTGEWTWDIPNDMEYPGIWTLCVAVDDGADICPPCNTTNADTACFTINIAGFRVVMECEDGEDHTGDGIPDGVLQGQMAEVSISLEGENNYPIGGFDFLIAYDNSVLSAISAAPGELIDDEFEYFTYRFGPFGNCDGGCPSGMLRVVGLREQNDGVTNPNHVSSPGELAKLNFMVSSDLTLECLTVPISFYWFDCGDNAISDESGNFLFLGLNVYNYEGILIDSADAFGYTGPDVECYDTVYTSEDLFKNAPLGAVYFQNGCIQIICTDDIDARGDVNLNGIANEVGDAVVFTNYFINGLAAFQINQAGQTAATEVNGDGVPLSVADLVYLIRVVIGDATPLPKLTPGEPVKFASNGSDISLASATPLGGALFVFDGQVSPTLAENAAQMDMKVGYLDGTTRVLVHPNFQNGGIIPQGEILHVDGDANLVSIEASDAQGAVVEVEKTIVLPTEFALGQNYPNPFNPSTTIELALPVAADWNLTVYNINGQRVKQFSGHDAAGTVQVVWDASNVASGMYFYKFNATGEDGVNFKDTRKMVLLK